MNKASKIVHDMISRNGMVADTCDICQRPITGWHVDGKTKMGPWADMCPECFKTHGVGVGTGKGQKYQGGKKIEG